MKLSTRSRYGLKAMFDLAYHAGEGPVVLRNIAARQAIPEQYLEQIFVLLRRAGLVKSIRGPQGGYVLLEPPDAVTVGRVIGALEGSLAPAECILQQEDICEQCTTCPTRYIWQKMYDGISEVVDSITLADMVSDYKEKFSPDQTPAPM